MRVLCVPLGPVQANCYVVIDQDRALVIDPGDAFPDLEKILKSNHAKLEAVLLTHAHFDHIGGLDEMLKTFGVDVYLNPLEFEFLEDARLNGSSAFGGYMTSKAQPKPLKEGTQNIGGFEVTAMTLVYPGHGPSTTIGQEKQWNPYFR